MRSGAGEKGGEQAEGSVHQICRLIVSVIWGVNLGGANRVARLRRLFPSAESSARRRSRPSRVRSGRRIRRSPHTLQIVGFCEPIAQLLSLSSSNYRRPLSIQALTRAPCPPSLSSQLVLTPRRRQSSHSRRQSYRRCREKSIRSTAPIVSPRYPRRRERQPGQLKRRLMFALLTAQSSPNFQTWAFGLCGTTRCGRSSGSPTRIAFRTCGATRRRGRSFSGLQAPPPPRRLSGGLF